VIPKDNNSEAIEPVSSVDNKNLEEKIDHITNSLSRQYFNTILKKLVNENKENAIIICDYIIVEQNEINIKDSTKEGKIKVLVWLSNFHKDKKFENMTKDDILEFLNSLRKPSDKDPTHKWIGSYNGRQTILLKFFKWLYNSNEPDNRKRLTPSCMQGIKRLTRKEKTSYEPGDIWEDRDHIIFLKYCPYKRDRCYHAMANDMSARPHEILGLKIKDIKFCITDDNVQYAEVRIKDGKTGPRSIPLIDSIPYLKEWLSEHPTSGNQNSWLFTIFANNSNETRLTYEGLASRYEYYKKRYFPSLLEDETIPESDKAIIRNMLTRPWNLYILRHSALTEKSQYLTESILRSHAGWTMSSKMPQVYIHLSGEPSKILLQKKGILNKENLEDKNSLKSKQCPNCFEPNKQDNRFCVKCRMVLSFNSYSEIRNEDKQKINKLENDMESLKRGMDKIFLLIQQNPLLAQIKPEILKDIGI